MELSSDFIKKNQHFLRSCILYEVLQKTPIFSAYKNFCSTVGNDVMEYPDFEFWFYRFYHGNLDLHYDRSADPEPKTLVDMPVVLMTKIVEFLDPVERTFLRFINHAIKDVADSFQPVFEKIEVTVSDTSVNWKLNNHSFSCAKEDGGCTLYKPNSSEAEESDECYMEKGIEKLALLLKTPDIQVDHLSLTVSNKMPNCADFLPMLFNAKSVFIYGRTAKIVVQFLSAMTPGYLESISLDGMYSEEMEYYGMIFKSDQFKQAKNVEFNMVTEFDVEDLVRFSHLKKFKCFLKSENAFEDVPRIRDIISTFKELESCELKFMTIWTDSPIVAFAEVLGAEFLIAPLAEDGHMTITHRYRIPESNECLEFQIKEEDYHCRVKIVKIH